MTERNIEAFIRSFTLIPSKGGVFEVVVNGEKVYSKKDLKRHAEPGEVLDLVRKKLDEIAPDRPKVEAKK